MSNDKGRRRCFKAKRSVVITAGGHDGVACMALEYHGDGDADGLLCKIGDMDVIDVLLWIPGQS